MESTTEVEALKQRIKEAKVLANRLPSTTRDKVLAAFREGLLLFQETILQANQTDLQEAAASGDVSPALLKRLGLDARRLQGLVTSIDALRQAPSPLGRCTLSTELTPGLHLYRISVPIGALLIIFEGRPEAFVQIASLGLKSGNVCLLKGGKEARRTNKALYDAYIGGIRSIFSAEGISEDEIKGLCSLIQLMESREDVQKLLRLNTCIDLVIPRGSKSLIHFIQNNTTIPIMGHADGICHAYADADSVSTKESLREVLEILRDSKLQYISACNALEVLLVHKDAANILLPALGRELMNEGVCFKADARAIQLLPLESTTLAKPQDFSTEWLSPILSVRVVDSLLEAIDMINTNGSHHTDVILSYTPSNIEIFMKGVLSADVFCNCSTRFADGYRYGFNAEVGIATGKTHARGPVGIEGLCTYMYRLYGKGHTVASIEEHKEGYTHRPLLSLEQRNHTDVRISTDEAIDTYEATRLIQQHTTSL